MLHAQLKKCSFVAILRHCLVSGCSEELSGMTVRTELGSELCLTAEREGGLVSRCDEEREKNQVFSFLPPLLDPP